MKIDYSKYQFEFQQRNKHPAMMTDMWMRALNTEFKKEINLSVFDSVDYIFSADFKGWVSKVHKSKILELIEAQSGNENYLKYIGSQIQKRLMNIEEIEKKILPVFKASSSSQLADLWADLDKVFVEFVPWFYIPWYVTEENILVDKVRKLLEPHRSEIEKITDFNNALSILISPVKRTAFQEDQVVFFKLVEEVKKNGFESQLYKQELKSYLDQFSFLTTWLFLDIPPKSEEDTKNQIKEALNDTSYEDFKLRVEAEKSNQIIKKELLSVLDDPSLLEVINFSQEFAWILTASVEDVFKIVARLQEFFHEISERIGISISDFTNLESKEIKELLEGNLLLKDINLEERRSGLLYKLEDKTIEKVFGQKALDLTIEINSKLNKVDKSITEFRGQPSSPGKVKGRVLLCLNSQESSNIKEGDILVTSMTTPDFVPAMKKAGAIVTSEGGLLCHAAIISRELKKPCIVGTKIATSILKTGDMVEVDANSGIVRIIK